MVVQLIFSKAQNNSPYSGEASASMQFLKRFFHKGAIIYGSVQKAKGSMVGLHIPEGVNNFLPKISGISDLQNFAKQRCPWSRSMSAMGCFAR
jgi:hypothetical protein